AALGSHQPVAVAIEDAEAVPAQGAQSIEDRLAEVGDGDEAAHHPPAIEEGRRETDGGLESRGGAGSAVGAELKRGLIDFAAQALQRLADIGSIEVLGETCILGDLRRS